MSEAIVVELELKIHPKAYNFLIVKQRDEINRSDR